MTSRVSVIIPAFGNEAALRMSLATLAAQTQPAHEVIIVDDGSKTPIEPQPGCILTRIDRDPAHRGSSAAKNHGASLARGDYLAFCDSDILHLPDALESLILSMHKWEDENEPDILLNTMRVSLPDGYKAKYLRDLNRLMRKCRSANLLNDEEMRTSALCYEQNESLIRAGFFRSLGGYDEAAFPSWGMNNQDLDLRVLMAGGRCSSAIPRISDGLRLHCFHQFHENHISKKQAEAEFAVKWGEPWSDGFYQRVRAMVESGGLPKRRSTLQEESACQ